MLRLPTPLRKLFESRHAAARRPLRYRPHCKPLEDRCLLSVSLTPSGPPVPLVGAPVTWTATATGHGSTPVYQFRVGPIGSASQVVRDFSTSNNFVWNPLQEGSYDIRVTVKDGFGASAVESADATYTAQSRVVGSNAVISPTSNPLVALYSAPPAAAGSMTVEFSQLGPNLSWRSTAPLPVVPGESTNFLVAGLLPKTTYLMRHVLSDGTTSTPLTFTTGSLPTNVTFPTFTQAQGHSPGNDSTQDMIYHIGIGNPISTINTVATNLQGQVEWYYDSVANGFHNYSPSVVPGGTVLLLGGKLGFASQATILREIDLAGDPLRETNIDVVNAELAAMGQHSITDFNHDAQRLPNGDTAVLANSVRTIDVKGTPTTYHGDMVLVLDRNFQLAWAWDPFQWLDTSRLGTDGEGPTDWTHANSVAWSPADGNLIVSMRSQDWVLKIAYSNGTGDGHIVWRLGKGGDFTITSSDPYPWFSHQHDARYVNDSTIVLFDDGNLRHDTTSSQDSRGQELILDEKTMQATLVVNADLGNYSAFLGGAQRLPGGNLTFTSGVLGSNPNFGQSIEVLPDGTRTYAGQMTGLEYRSYFMSTLYGSPANHYDPGFEDPPQGNGMSAYHYNPTGSAWTYSGSSGLAGGGGAFTAANPDAPQGSQVAFLQETGTISQVVDFYPATGAYVIRFSAAQRGNYGPSAEQVRVLVDGTPVGTFTPTGTGYATYTTAAFQVAAGSHTIRFVGVDPTGADYTALLDGISIDSISPPAPPDPNFVDLSSAFDRTGIAADGATFAGGGLDYDGYALSSSLVGGGLATGDATFELGPAGAKDVVGAAGQTIALSPGNDAALKLLATGVNCTSTGLANQAFVVTYTDGTTATFTRSISDWANPKGFAGETTALTTAYRGTAGGGRQSGTFRLYEYTLALDPTKVVKSLTLPNNGNVEVLAATLVPAGTRQVDLSSAFNRTGIAADGAVFGGGGLDYDGNALSSSLVGTSLTAGGAVFHLGPAGASDVVSAGGQTIALPVGRDSALKLLATGVNGAQANQVFVVTYTDGTTATFTRSISDWAIPKNYLGESTALATAYRDTAGGTQQGGQFNVYEYTLALDPTKVVKSLTLPNNGNVEVLAATLVPLAATQVDLSSAFDQTGIVADGTKFAGGGLDGGSAFSSSLVGASLAAGGVTFQLGPAGAPDVVAAAGQAIALPAGRDAALALLATGVDGSQANQAFVVTYTDGTTATFTRSISDWAYPQGYPGESTALATAYRDQSDGTKQAGTFRIYEYTLALDPTRMVKSLILPNNGNVEVLAIDVLP